MADVQDIDKGWRKMVASLKPGQGLDVVAGFTGGGAGADDVSAIAGYNEFGANIKVFGKWPAVIPPRPFMRNAWHKNIDKWQEQFGRDMKRATATVNVDLVAATALALQRVGTKMQADIRQEIVDLREPPNALLTLKLKAPKTNPLINTGSLKGHVTYEVRSR